MKKFFTLVTLALTAISGAWAETYSNEPVTATWSMADGSTSVSVVSPDAAALSTSWGVGSNMTFNNVTTYFSEYKMSTFNTITSVSSATKANGSYVEWSFTPNPGLTFTPTNVSFNVVKDGTGDPSAYVYFIDGDGTEITLGEKETIVRNNASSASGISHSYSLSGKDAASSSNTVKLRVYTGKHANNKKVGFSDVVIEGTVTGTTSSVTTYMIEAESSDLTLGTVSGGNSYAADATAELTATALTGGKFVKWQIKNGDDYEDFSGNTANPLSVTVTADASYKAVFKALYKITFTAGEGAYIGNNKNDLPTTYAETTYNTPAKNSYISKPGYTATGWTDGTNNYSFGEEITLTGDIELQPIFAANTKSLADLTENKTVTWEFRRTNGGVLLNIENSTGYYVIQQVVAGETIDLPIFINNKDNSGYSGKRGKTNNVSSDKQTQVNPGSVFTLPALSGMEIRINAANAFNVTDNSSDGAFITQIGGVSMNDYLTESKKGIVYTYIGSDETVDIIFGSGFGYLYNIVVTYPKMVESVSISSAGYATLYSESALAIPSGVKAYTGKVNGSNLVLTEVTDIIPASTAVVLEGAEGNYTFNVTTAAAFDGENDLEGGTGAAAATGDLVLGIADEVVGFYSYTGTLATNKAYLPAAKVASAPAIYFSFEDETEVTGVYNLRVEEKANAAFDLSGRRANGKGLMIQNGKVVLVK